MALEGPAGLTGRPRATEPQRAWDLLIAGYLYLGGLGAGAFAVATVASWLGLGLGPSTVTLPGGLTADWAALFLFWGPFATALGAALLVFHLGRNRLRFWSAGFNPRTSWMARGFSILLAFIVLGGIAALVSVFLPAEPERAPVLWYALEAVAVVAALGTAVYTGILLRSMAFIPAWRSAALPWLFLASALSTGSMGLVLGGVAYGLVSGDGTAAAELTRGLAVVEPFVIAVEAALLAAYVTGLRRGKPAGRLSAGLWLSGRWRLGFWGGIVGLALVLPVVLVPAELVVGSWILAATAALSVLAGGFVLRCGVLAIGITEAPPLYRLAQLRASVAAVVGQPAGRAAG